MMRKGTPIDLLDESLRIFANRQLWNDAFTVDLFATYLSKVNVQVVPFSPQEVLNKLEQDGYIYKTNDKYRITLNGYVFLDMGAYAGQIHRESDKYLSDAKTAKAVRILTHLTYWIAAGTLVAAVYYMIEIRKSLL